MQDTNKLETLKLALDEAEEESKKLFKIFEEANKAYKAAKKAYEEEWSKSHNCSECRYSVVLKFIGFGGDHNGCGCPDAPCTCCHRTCKYFEPDNYITTALKEANITPDSDDVEAIQLLYLDMLNIDEVTFDDNGDARDKAIYDKIIATLKLKYSRD